MSNFEYMLNGFAVALEPQNLLFILTGTVLGTIVGVLPGLGPSAGIALLLPLTFGMDPTGALIMVASMYYGAMYGGSTTSILINTPGESSSVMTTLDGYQMARNGRAGAALAVSAIGSFIAGTFSVIALSILAVPLARFGLKFGPVEYFALMLFSMAAVSSLTGKSVSRGLFSMVIGLMIATVGIDLQSGSPRFTGSVPQLQDGISFLVIAVGMFAVSEVLVTFEDHVRGQAPVLRIKGRLWLTREEWRRSIMPITRGTLIGFAKGVLPGPGATISTILSYGLERALHKDKEKFGTGMIEGVAGPEAANNAAAGGAMVPLLTLGLPSGGTTAVLLGAFIMYGLQPGPLMMTRNPDVVWGLIDSMYLGNIMLFILNLPLIFLFVRLLYIPTGILLPLILTIATIGVFSIDGSTLDLAFVLGFGVVGYIFRKLDVPLAPMVLAVVLGKSIEQSFRQSITISGGDMGIFLSSGLSITFLVLAGLMFVLPLAWNHRSRLLAAVGFRPGRPNKTLS
ncbi:putative tricarboxylic transport membrane protein [Aureimonas altamirensis DSM 21988]|jgi:putative tricarboxylic transport membrane protein|uniref:Tricarboxylic transport membrane protein n=1 Tax=Aureimonas altamirensis DSM 21988 TaxID=1121026 RepID=A0ABY1IPL2_9HYPH|nr:tripartite tricarboxylate transporter permease [Aureimonas altamirensis]SHJ78672.1 putative tricarboxylic transport membrane protein [Aureimonas altamirensis DSM 21988]